MKNPESSIYKKNLLIGCLACILLLFAGCSFYPFLPDASKKLSGGYEVTDMQGTVVQIPHKPMHILTLSMSLDEILLGMVPSDRLAAISNYLDDPKLSVVVKKAQRVPEKISSITPPSAERVMALNPDLVLVTEWTRPDYVATLRDLGFPVVVCGGGRSLEDIQDNICLLARCIDEETRGQQLIAQMKQLLEEIQEKTAVIPDEKRKNVVLISMMTNYGGSGCTYDAMCQNARVINGIAAAGLKNGQELTKEMIIKINPDILFLPNYDDHGTYDTDSFIHEYLDDPSLQTVLAIRNNACYYPRESYIYNASQDFVFGVQELDYYAYGDSFRQGDNRHISFSGEE